MLHQTGNTTLSRGLKLVLALWYFIIRQKMLKRIRINMKQQKVEQVNNLTQMRAAVSSFRQTVLNMFKVCKVKSNQSDTYLCMWTQSLWTSLWYLHQVREAPPLCGSCKSCDQSGIWSDSFGASVFLNTCMFVQSQSHKPHTSWIVINWFLRAGSRTTFLALHLTDIYYV